MLSTVSGGSILGGCYILQLKHRYESNWGALTRRDYEEVVAATEAALRRGVRKNLRTRLLMTPWWNLRMLCSDFSWGRRMARLYQRYLFRDAARRINPAWKSGVPLQDLKFRPPGRGMGFDVELHNREAARQAEPTLVPKWVINATSLNTGRDFRFTMAEIGDPELGAIRFDETATVLAYKRLLATAQRRSSDGPEWFPDMVTEARDAFLTRDEPWLRHQAVAGGGAPVDAIHAVARRIRPHGHGERCRLERALRRGVAAFQAGRRQSPHRQRLQARVDDHAHALPDGGRGLEEPERVAGPDLERLDPEMAAPDEGHPNRPRALGPPAER